MATIDAARTAQIDAGEIAPGKLADVIVLDLNKAHIQPFHEDDPINMLVFCARSEDVRDTVIHGKIVMQNRRVLTVDETQILNESITVERELFKSRKDYAFAY